VKNTAAKFPSDILGNQQLIQQAEVTSNYSTTFFIYDRYQHSSHLKKFARRAEPVVTEIKNAQRRRQMLTATGKVVSS